MAAITRDCRNSVFETVSPPVKSTTYGDMSVSVTSQDLHQTVSKWGFWPGRSETRPAVGSR